MACCCWRRRRACGAAPALPLHTGLPSTAPRRAGPTPSGLKPSSDDPPTPPAHCRRPAPQRHLCRQRPGHAVLQLRGQEGQLQRRASGLRRHERQPGDVEGRRQPARCGEVLLPGQSAGQVLLDRHQPAQGGRGVYICGRQQRGPERQQQQALRALVGAGAGVARCRQPAAARAAQWSLRLARHAPSACRARPPCCSLHTRTKPVCTALVQGLDTACLRPGVRLQLRAGLAGPGVRRVQGQQHQRDQHCQHGQLQHRPALRQLQVRLDWLRLQRGLPLHLPA